MALLVVVACEQLQHRIMTSYRAKDVLIDWTIDIFLTVCDIVIFLLKATDISLMACAVTCGIAHNKPRGSSHSFTP